jgi:excisionase family DNA binding protein
MKSVTVLLDDDGHFWLDTPDGPEPIRNLPHLYTEEEVAEYFGVTTHAVRWWRKQGVVTFIKVSGQVRFTHDAIMELLRDRTVRANGSGQPIQSEIAS